MESEGDAIESENETDTDSSREEVGLHVKESYSFSASDFLRSLGSTINDIGSIKGLKKFCKQADQYNKSPSGRDIVHEFLRIPESWSKLIVLLEEVKINSYKFALVCQGLSCLLIRLSSDLSQLAEIGHGLVASLLRLGMDPFIRQLDNRHRPKEIMATLQLLTLVVALGPQPAKDLAPHLNTLSNFLLPLLDMRNIQVSLDVHTCVVHFIMAFLVSGVNNVIRIICEHNNLLAAIICGLPSDKPSLIQHFMLSLQTKVLENPSVTKTLKVRILNEHSLQSIFNLLSWNGAKVPVKKKQPKKSKQVEQTWLLQEASLEDIEIVRESAFQFLLVACASHRWGIIFHKNPLKPERNPNHTVTKLLVSQKQAFEEPRSREMVAQILKACPDLMTSYLKQVRSCFEPRPSLPWVQSMQFMARAVTLQDLEELLSGLDAVLDNDLILKELLNSLGLFVVNKKIIFTALRSQEKFVRLSAIDYLIVVCTKLNSLSRGQSSFKTINIKTLISKVLQTLPTLNEILLIFLDGESIPSAASEISPDVTFTVIDYLTKTVDLLTLYSEGIFHFGLEESVSVYKVLAVIQKQKQTLDRDTIASLYLKVLKILTTGSSSADFWLKQKNATEEGPLFMLFDLYLQASEENTAKEAKELIRRMFSSLETFHSCSFELDVWLEELQRQPLEQRDSCTRLLWRCVCLYLKEPHFYVDKVVECKLKASGQSVALHRPDITFEELLKLYEQGLALKLGSENILTGIYFSPMVAAVLQQLTLEQDLSTEVHHAYLQSVLLEIFHHQTDPEALCHLLESYSTVLPKLVIKYARFWQTEIGTGEEKSVKKEDKFWKRYMKQMLHPTQTEELMYAFVLICQSGRGNVWTEKKRLKGALARTCKLDSPKVGESLLRQALLYLHMQLQTIPIGNQMNGVLILCLLLDNLLSYLCSPEHDESAHWKAVSTLLLHPMAQTWFLTLSNTVCSSEHSEKASKSCKLLTALVCKCLSYAKTLVNDPQQLSSLFQPFQSKLIKCTDAVFRNAALDVYSVWDNLTLGIESCLHQLPATKSADLINSLLTVPISEFLDFPNSLKVLNELLKHFVEHNSTATCSLQSSTVEALFEAVIISLSFGIKVEYDLDKNLLRFLKQCPLSSVAVSAATLQHLLNRGVPGSLRLALVLVQHSSVHRCALRVWLEKNASSIVQWPASLSLRILNFAVQWEVKRDPLVNLVARMYWHCLSTLVAREETDSPGPLLDSLDVRNVLGTLLAKDLVQDSLEVVTEQLFRESLSCDRSTVPSPIRLEILTQVFQCLDACSLSFKVRDLTPGTALCRMQLLWLTVLLEDPATPSTDLLPFALQALQLFQDVKPESVDVAALLDSKMWFKLVTLTLKKGLKCNVTGPTLFRLLSWLYRLVYASPKLLPTTRDLMQLLHGHSSFQPIMIEDNDQLPLLKDPIIDLMSTLVELDPSCCHVEHFPIMLGAYRATLAPTDQKLLYLMRAYEVNGTSMQGFRPFLWGPSAVSYYSSMAKCRLSLWKQPKLEDIVHLLDKEMLLRSTLLFPINIALKPQKEAVIASHCELDQQKPLYDPRFLLLVLSHFLEAGSVLDCDQFVSSGCFAYLLSSLSSLDEGLRSLGYQAVSRLYLHLEGTMNLKSHIWHFVLDTLKNALRNPNVQLPSIFTCFMVKAVTVLLHPDDYLFTTIYQFFALKPAVDLTNVPEFYTLFYSSDVQHHWHRTWLLKLLLKGMRTSLDFHVCQKRYVFQILLSYSPSPICSLQHKILILGILRAALRVHSSALVLCKAQGLLAWFQALVTHHIPSQYEEEMIAEVVQTLQVLWATAQQEPNSELAKKKAEEREQKSPSNSEDKECTPKKNKHFKTLKLEKDVMFEDDHLVSENIRVGQELDIINSQTEIEMSEIIVKRKTSKTKKRSSEVGTEQDVVVEEDEPKHKRKRMPPDEKKEPLFYAFFPNQFLLVCLSLLENPRIQDDLSTLHRLLKFTHESCSCVTTMKPFITYLCPSHLKVLLNVAMQPDTSSSAKSISRLQLQNQESLRHECRSYSLRLIMLISPKIFQHSCEERQVFSAIVSLLQNRDVESKLVPATCHWLMNCLNSELSKDHFKGILKRNPCVLQCAFLLLDNLTRLFGEVSVRSKISEQSRSDLLSLVKLFLVLLPQKHPALAKTCKDTQGTLEDDHCAFLDANVSKLFPLVTVIQEAFLTEIMSADSENDFIERMVACKPKMK